MKLRLIVAAIVIVVAQSYGRSEHQVQSAPQPPLPDRYVIFRAVQGGVPMVWEISKTRGDALPHWDLDATAPPVAAAQSIQIARAWLARRNPSVERFFVQQVGLSRVGTGFWHYVIYFVAPSGRPGTPNTFYVVVLPDGSVLEPSRQ